MENIKCSIITTSYNSAATIEQTILSVLNQTYENIEYIIVDGASTDGTVDIIKRYEPEFKGRMHWVSEPDEGIYYAMNKGIERSQGELVGILNSDDTYEADAVKTMVEAMGDEKYQVVYGAVNTWRGEELVERSFASHEILPDEMICHPGCFVTKSVYEDFGVFNTRYVSVADFEFMARLSGIKEVVFHPVDKVVTNFYMGGMSASDRAYMDLLKYQSDMGKISKVKYAWHCVLQKMIDIKRKLVGKK